MNKINFVESVKAMLKERENIHLEFKLASYGKSDSMWETYSAFANTKGGFIILGVRDENGFAKEFVDITNPSMVKNKILNEANNKSVVNVNLLNDDDIEIVNIDNRNILVIHVKEADSIQKPIYLKGLIDNTYIRKGEGDQKADINSIRYFLTFANGPTDTALLDNYDIDDINIDSLIDYLGVLNKKSSKRIEVFDDNYKDVLIQLGVYRKTRSDLENCYKLTKGGLLFFGKYNSIRDCFPHFQLDYFQYASSSETRWIDKISTGDMEYPEMNVYSFYKTVFEKLNITAQDKFMLDNSNEQRLPFRSDLQEAVREAFVNSIMHAYYDSDLSIKIEAHDDYYTFFNPGGMRISKEEFFEGGISKTSNEVISTLLRRIGASEKAGSGGRIIAEVAEKYNLRCPDVINEFDRTTVKIWKEDLLSTLNLPEEEMKIMKYMMKNCVASKAEICKQLNISSYYFRSAINNLLDSKLIEVIGGGRSTRYTLAMTTPNTKAAWKRSLMDFFD